MAQPPVETCEEQCSGAEPTCRVLQVTCGQNRAEFHVHKMRMTGKSVGKCVLFQSKWVSPPEFENMSRVHPTKKWRKSIKYKGEPIGDWLAKNQQDHSLNPFQDSQKPQELSNPQLTQLEQTPAKENNGNNGQLLMESQDSSPQNDLPEVVRKMGEMLDRMSSKIEALTQEVMDQETRHKNATKELRRVIQEQDAKIAQLEDQIQNQVSSPQSPPVPAPPKSYAQVTTEKKLQDLEDKVISLTSKQVSLERERDKLQRKCNIIIGNLEESSNSTEDREKVVEILQSKLNVEFSPLDMRRVGKKTEGKARIILVKFKTEQEKIQLLKKAPALKGSKLYLAEDLTIDERRERRIQVEEMKRARQEGKRAYIRFSDGKLVINGKVIPPQVEETCTNANI